MIETALYSTEVTMGSKAINTTTMKGSDCQQRLGPFGLAHKSGKEGNRLKCCRQVGLVSDTA